MTDEYSPKHAKVVTDPQEGSEDVLNDLIRGLLTLPHTPGISFRGWVPDPELPAHTLVTKAITATSANPVVATAGWSTGQLAIIIGRTGRDITFLSQEPEAKEVTYPPATMFHAHAPITLDNMLVRIYEEYTPAQSGIKTMDIDIEKVLATAADEVAKKQDEPLPVPAAYCERFTSALK